MMLAAVQQYLQSEGVGIIGTNLFRYEMPDGADIADPCITLFDYAGPAPIRVQPRDQSGPGIASTIVEDSYVQPRLQVLVRSAVEGTAFDKAYEAWSAVSRVKNMALDGVWYCGIEPIQEPYLLRRDENRRYNVIFNAEVMKRVG